MATPKKSPWEDVNLINLPQAQLGAMSTPDPMLMAQLIKEKPPEVKKEMPVAVQDLMAQPMPKNMKLSSVSMSEPLTADQEWENAIKQDIQERTGGVKGMQKQVDELKAKEYGMKDVDLTPAFALTDSWMKTNLASHYKAPNQMAEDKQTIAKLEEAMAKQKGEITDDMIQLLKEKSQNSTYKLALDNARQARFDESLSLKKEDNVRKDVNKITDEYNRVQADLNVADQAIRAGDTRGVMMVVSSIARNVGDQKGALSDGDVARTMPPDVATNVAQLEAYLGSNPRISPQLQNAFLTLINRAREKSSAIRQESLARRKAQYSAGAYAPIMQQGRVGDVIFNEASKGAEQISTANQNLPTNDAQSWLQKYRSSKPK